MTTLPQSRGFQFYNNYKTRTSLPIKIPIPMSPIDESLVFGRIPYSSIQISTRTIPPSTDGIAKSASMTPKRRSSTLSLSNLLPRRKSLQTTALAVRRQSLWMNIAKNASATDDVQPSILPLRQDHSNLMRKKFLRLLLVFSYLISISLFAIALATFYGFFWSGYNTQETTNVLDVKPSFRSIISLTSNSTFVDTQSEIEDIISDEQFN
jgi:hypothetical protein